jgi:hypothetical protein
MQLFGAQDQSQQPLQRRLLQKICEGGATLERRLEELGIGRAQLAWWIDDKAFEKSLKKAQQRQLTLELLELSMEKSTLTHQRSQLLDAEFGEPPASEKPASQILIADQPPTAQEPAKTDEPRKGDEPPTAEKPQSADASPPAKKAAEDGPTAEEKKREKKRRDIEKKNEQRLHEVYRQLKAERRERKLRRKAREKARAQRPRWHESVSKAQVMRILEKSMRKRRLHAFAKTLPHLRAENGGPERPPRSVEQAHVKLQL